MIEAVLFDMDGLLIDSEPLWRAAEKEIFSSVDITLTDEMCFQTVGLRIDEVVDYWHERFPWNNRTKEALVEDIVQRMEELILAQGEPLPGVFEALALCEKRGLKMAVASSSFERLIEAVLTKFNVRDRFQVVHSAEFEDFGKPHPAVFISAAQQLGVPPTRCLVFEDSVGGVIAAKAARMPCIAVPEEVHQGNPRYAIADLQLKSLLEFTDQHLDQLGQ